MASKTTIEKGLATIFERKELEDVHFFSKAETKVSALEEVYFQVLNHCDRQQLYFEKGFYVLVVSRLNNVSIQITVKPTNKSHQKEKLEKLLRLIKHHRPFSKVFLGQNNPRKSVSPDQHETLLARHLESFSKEHEIKLIDQFIMSSTEYFSFNENDYMRDK